MKIAVKMEVWEEIKRIAKETEKEHGLNLTNYEVLIEELQT